MSHAPAIAQLATSTSFSRHVLVVASQNNVAIGIAAAGVLALAVGTGADEALAVVVELARFLDRLLEEVARRIAALETVSLAAEE